MRGRLRDLFYKTGIMWIGLPVIVLALVRLPYPKNVVTAVFLLFIYGALQVLLYFVRSRLAVLDPDLLYLLLHLRLVASGKPPTSRLFRVIADEARTYREYARYFRDIYLLGKEWGYSFPRATGLVGERVDNEVLRNILMRLSGVLSVGEDVEEFLDREYRTLLSEYVNVYTRSMNNARVILGIYVTMLGSLVFLVSTFMLLAFFFGGDARIIQVSYLGVTTALMLLSLLIFLSLRKEPFEFYGDPELPRYRALRYAGAASLLAAALAGGLVVYYMGGLSYSSLAAAFLAAGVIVLPVGAAAKRIEGYISEIDEFYSVFIRSYGSHYATIPNMVEALRPLLISSLGRLLGLVKRLYARLLNSLDPSISWSLFSAESGSELVRRGTRIFLDAVEGGGDAALAGSMISDHHSEMIRLRKLRMQVASTFSSTLFIMHGTAVVILIIMSKLMEVFSEILSRLSAEMPAEIASIFPFEALDPEPLYPLNLVLLTVFSLVNSGVVTRVVPGTNMSYYFYLSLYLVITAAGVFIASALINYIIGQVTLPEVTP